MQESVRLDATRPEFQFGLERAPLSANLAPIGKRHSRHRLPAAHDRRFESISGGRRHPASIYAHSKSSGLKFRRKRAA
jgi:hypothetical protein